MASSSKNSRADGLFEDEESDASGISDSSDDDASDIDEHSSDSSYEWSMDEKGESEDSDSTPVPPWWARTALEGQDQTPAPMDEEIDSKDFDLSLQPPSKRQPAQPKGQAQPPAPMDDEELDSKDFDLSLQPPSKKQPAPPEGQDQPPASMDDEELDSKDFDLSLQPPSKKRPAPPEGQDQPPASMDDEEIDSKDFILTLEPPSKWSAHIPPKGPAQPPAPVQPCARARQAAATTSPNGTTCMWTSQPTGPAPAIILTQEKGPQNLGGASRVLELFELFFSVDMMQIILDMSNVQGIAKRGQSWVKITMVELRSFIGLLLYLGLTKSGHEKARTFWTPGLFCKPTCQATMPAKRFEDLITMMCFDDKATRTQRKATDKFAPIREIFNMFAAALRQHYSPGECITIDEQMAAFRGRCSFRQYSPNKPERYGIKFWSSVDSDSHYVHNMIPYIDKEHCKNRKRVGARVVKELVRPLFGTGRNVTAHNFFVSKELADFLLSKKITLVGAIKNIQQEVPQKLQKENVKGRAVKSSQFLFSGMATIVSFVPSKHRNVLVLSTKHHDEEVNEANLKPEVIRHYNATKGCVDTVSQMCSLYNCARISKSWPMVVFFHMLNVAAINAYILFHQVHPNFHGEAKTRWDFLRQLVTALIEPQIQLRAAHPEKLRGQTIPAMRYIGLDVDVRHQPEEVHAREYKQGRCFICPRGMKTRTTRVCSKCNHFSCKQHCISRRTSESFCSDCLEAD